MLVFKGFTGFYWVLLCLPDDNYLPMFYLQDVTEFDCSSLVFTVLLGFTEMQMFNWVSLGLVVFLLGFTDF